MRAGRDARGAGATGSPIPRALRVRGSGLYEISGLVWSGYGEVAKVEVSADGGKSWGRCRSRCSRRSGELAMKRRDSASERD
jgi:hypothetical protein